MAQRLQTLFIDDIDGGEAEGTVRFGLDGADFEIDLNATHSAGLRDTLETYIRHGRRVSGSHRAVRGRAGEREVDTHQVREWAREHGFDVKERGRVPADVMAKYRASAGS